MLPQIQNKEYYQKAYNKNQHSPVINPVTHDKWSSRHIRSLNEVHKQLPPTDFATIKFNEVLDDYEINKFIDTILKAANYENSKNPQEPIHLFAVLNPDKAGLIHYHVLIRTQKAGIHEWFLSKIDKYNKKHNRKITIEYLKPVESGEACAIYPFKLGNPNKLLLCTGTKIRHTFYLKYFDGYKKSELAKSNLEQFKNSFRFEVWKDEKQAKELAALELEVDQIIGCIEDWNEWTFEILANRQSDATTEEVNEASAISEASYAQERERKRVQRLRKKERRQSTTHQTTAIDPKQIE